MASFNTPQQLSSVNGRWGFAIDKDRTLNDLSDVNLTNLQDGDVIIWNNVTMMWENGPQGSGVETLGDLTDVEPDGGLGSTVGDRLTYVGTTYPFINPLVPWLNVSVISGSIAFENMVTPLIITIPGNDIPQLVDFAGVLQVGSFLVTTNGLGRLINSDSFAWAFNVNFSASFTGGSNTEWTIELYINGSKVSNAYNLVVPTNNKFVSMTGVWTQSMNGGSTSGPPPNQYCEIFVTRTSGSSDATFNSCYLSMTAIKLLDRP